MAEAGAVLPGALAPEAFFGRVGELQRLRRDARALLRGRGRSRALCARPGAGRSELLLQWHGRLFHEAEVLPLLVAVPAGGDDLRLAAEFAGQVALQALAFARRDPSLLLQQPSPASVAAGLRPAFGGAGVLLAEALAPGGDEVDAGRRLAQTLLLPHRFSLAAGVRLTVMIDDAPNLCTAGGTAAPLARAAASPTAPLLLALEDEAELTLLLGPGAAAVASLDRLGPLSLEALRQLARQLARVAGLALDEAAVAALADEAAGSPFYLAAVVRALGEHDGAGPAEIARAGAAAARAGARGRDWLDRLEAHLPERGVRATGLEILAHCLRAGDEPPETGRLAAAMLKPAAEVDTALEALRRAGVVRIDCARIVVDGDQVFREAVLALYRREFEGASPSAVTAACAAARVRGAPAAGRRRDEVRFREALGALLLAWDGQQVPRDLFEASSPGRLRDAGQGGAAGEPAAEVTLPRVISVAAGRVGVVGPPAGGELDALAWGLRGEPGAPDAEVAWAVRRVPGGEGSAAQLSGFDRQVAALQAAGDLPQQRLVRWAILDAPPDPEGEREAAGLRMMTSTRAQLTALAGALGVGAPPWPASVLPAAPPTLEMEMVIPRAADAELVAARALEQLAENLGMSQEDAGRLKTALVEACINAFEHSGDRGGRVRLWFAAAGGRLVVRVENRGRPLSSLPAPAAGAGPRRRGWGLTLMRQLLDEVRIEPREDGVSLVLEKEIGGRSRG